MTLQLANPATVLAHLRVLSTGQRGRLCAVVLVYVASACAGLGPPLVFGRLVDDAVSGATSVELLGVGALLACAVVAGAALSAVGIVISGRLFARMLADLRERLIAAALALPARRLERAGVGELVSRAGDDVDQVAEAVDRAVPALCGSVAAVGVTGLGLVVLDWRFLVAFAVLVPVQAVAVRQYLRAAPGIYRAERAAAASQARVALGSLAGADTVRALGHHESHRARVDHASWESVRWAMRAQTVQNRFSARLSVAEFVGVAAVLVVGFALVRSGAGTIGAVTAAVLLLVRVFGPIGELLMVLDDLQQAGAALARIIGVLVEKPAEPLPTEPLDHVARLDAVTFGYTGRPVLDEVSLTIAHGEHIALVGASGAGKSTLAGLLTGAYRPDRGTVTHRTPARGRREVALVAQETHVFTGTIRENLALAGPGNAEAALRAVGATWVAALPDQVDTAVGAGAHQLTPAQAQQLALARLLIADPELAVLDEATAEAGPGDLPVLDRAVAAAIAGRAAVIVAHRLGLARTADRVVVLTDGRITETGTHDELLRAGGGYARLWREWANARATRPTGD